MKPPLYLTRASDWVGGPSMPISEVEWWQFAKACSELVCETRMVLMADQAGNEFTADVRQPVFLAGSEGSDPANCLFWDNGCIATADAPSDDIVKTLLAIAMPLRANVQDTEFVRLTPATRTTL